MIGKYGLGEFKHQIISAISHDGEIIVFTNTDRIYKLSHQQAKDHDGHEALWIELLSSPLPKIEPPGDTPTP